MPRVKDEPDLSASLDRALVERLHADVLQALDLVTESDSQFYRRVFVYTVFSAMEGVVYRLKRNILYWSNELGHTRMGSADRAALQDETYSVDDAGKARVRPMRTPLPA